MHSVFIICLYLCMSNKQKQEIMKIKKGTQESKFLLENEKGYVYKSIISYDKNYDVVTYVVDNKKGDYGDRFYKLEEALEFFNNNI